MRILRISKPKSAEYSMQFIIRFKLEFLTIEYQIQVIGKTISHRWIISDWMLTKTSITSCKCRTFANKQNKWCSESECRSYASYSAEKRIERQINWWTIWTQTLNSLYEFCIWRKASDACQWVFAESPFFDSSLRVLL